ncbi:MAG: GNAT family N-acetyltransferase [Cyanosarcina radialis HA8281-LM2]|jgi:ribosomal protein S18 acetylase RimI-like enzyme|nr:GNAT family N-acetyltransferase [Cyanosarcina radialis HA8281-LM2]
MSILETRKTAIADFSFIYDLHRQTMYSYVEQTWGWKEEVQLQGMQEDFDNSLFEIVCLNEQDIGVISVIDRGNEMFLNYLAILPIYQKQGLGTQLVRQVLSQAAERGVPVKLNVMRVNPAKELYDRLGFKVVDSDRDRYFMEWQNTLGS